MTVTGDESIASLVKHFTFDWAELCPNPPSKQDLSFMSTAMLITIMTAKLNPDEHLLAALCTDPEYTMVCLGILSSLQNLKILEIGFISFQLEILLWRQVLTPNTIEGRVLLPNLRTFARLSQ
jgi:hypothetical protein